MTDEAAPPYVFGVIEEELYNKCLFKSISVNELKHELELRKISFSPEDTFHIMVAKLKLDILEKCDTLKAVRDDLINEIVAFNSTGAGSGREKSGYKCCLSGCKFVAKIHKSYVSHLQFHGPMNQKIVCKLKGCKRELTNLEMLKTHIKTIHR